MSRAFVPSVTVPPTIARHVLGAAGGNSDWWGVPWIVWSAAGYMAVCDLPVHVPGPGASVNALATVVLDLALLLAIARELIRRARGVPEEQRWAAVIRSVPIPLLPLLLFTIWAGAQLPRSWVLGYGAQNLAVYFVFAGSAWYTAWTVTPDTAHRVLRHFGVGAAVATGLFVVGMLLPSGGIPRIGARCFGLVAVVMVAAVIAGRFRYHAWLLAGSILALVGFRHSRTGFVAIALVMVAWWVSHRVGVRAVVRAAVALPAAAAVAYLALALSPSARAHMFGGDQLNGAVASSVRTAAGTQGQRSTGQTGGAEAVGNTGTSMADSLASVLERRLPPVRLDGRPSFWAVTWRSAREHLLLGHGLGTADDVVRQRYAPVDQPHNDYLRMLHDTGAVGLGLWLTAVGMLLFRLRRAARSPDGPGKWRPTGPAWAAAVALVGVCLTMLTDNTLIYGFVMLPLGVLVGAGLAATRSAGATLPADSAARTPSRKLRTILVRS